jgi:hypothetical protein
MVSLEQEGGLRRGGRLSPAGNYAGTRGLGGKRSERFVKLFCPCFAGPFFPQGGRWNRYLGPPVKTLYWACVPIQYQTLTPSTST